MQLARLPQASKKDDDDDDDDDVYYKQISTFPVPLYLSKLLLARLQEASKPVITIIIISYTFCKEKNLTRM
jgi:hypothetical protein